MQDAAEETCSKCHEYVLRDGYTFGIKYECGDACCVPCLTAWCTSWENPEKQVNECPICARVCTKAIFPSNFGEEFDVKENYSSDENLTSTKKVNMITSLPKPRITNSKELQYDDDSSSNDDSSSDEDSSSDDDSSLDDDYLPFCVSLFAPMDVDLSSSNGYTSTSSSPNYYRRNRQNASEVDDYDERSTDDDL